MAGKKPNILIIFGDDIGFWNVSAYNRGMMGYRTPNIDRIGKEGVICTDAYGQQSCTAGRAAFILGQTPARTGLTKIGMPGGKEGIQPEDPTIAELLKPLGYATGQFGKNHLGDLDEHLPTVHGFDEFFGNLYHLNAEEEPEHPDYPKDPEFKKKFGPRGVLRSKADGKGGQTVEDTGPLTKKRMETIDEEFLAPTLEFIDHGTATDTSWFVWFNTTRMHDFTHLKPESAGKTGLGVYADGMVETDGHVGQLLSKLDQLGIADNTIVVYTTDNGAQFFSWPDGGTTPFKSEKNTTWEGGFRIPLLIRWPGVIPAGTELNEIISLEDLMPTLLAAAGNPDVKRQLLDGYKGEFKTFKVHLDGFNFMPYFTEGAEWPRKWFVYWTDDADFAGFRYGQYKLLYAIQEAKGLEVWRFPLTKLRGPMMTSVRSDPFEKAFTDAPGFADWTYHHMYLMVPGIALVSKFLATFKDYPPRQAPGSFNVDAIIETMTAGSKKMGL
ncbi:MAG: arylsulfatase [Chroococcidiopsidaceae cyanobacterium CP_BM_RX_35]|nr:arylsulfatase [Chroococcidiopsidaceae cyanobacterium CP_BM_RX_35]